MIPAGSASIMKMIRDFILLILLFIILIIVFDKLIDLFVWIVLLIGDPGRGS